jgi:hypothetical protein
MGTLAVVMLHIFAEYLQEVALIQHDHMVKALAAERPNDSLRHRVRVGGAYRCHDSS